MRATEPIGSIGAAFYFHPDTLAAGKAAGLDGFRMHWGAVVCWETSRQASYTLRSGTSTPV